MPLKGQKRELPRDLREVLADNLNALMGDEYTDTQVGNISGVGRNTVKRIRAKEVAANLDTVSAIATAFDIQPWLLLMKDGAASVGKVFQTPAPDIKLGHNWTRPDRKQPLLQSGNAKSSTRRPKIKIK